MSSPTNSTIEFFTADWCGNCKALKPIVEKLAKARGLEVVFIDVDTETEKAVANGVLSIPAVFFGGKKFVGVKDRAFIEQFLKGE